MQTLGYSIDRYLGELSRRGLAPKTTTRYRTILNEFADGLPREWALPALPVLVRDTGSAADSRHVGFDVGGSLRRVLEAV